MVRMRLPQHYFLPANYYYIPKAKTSALAQPPQGLRGEMNVHYLTFLTQEQLYSYALPRPALPKTRLPRRGASFYFRLLILRPDLAVKLPGLTTDIDYIYISHPRGCSTTTYGEVQGQARVGSRNSEVRERAYGGVPAGASCNVGSGNKEEGRRGAAGRPRAVGWASTPSRFGTGRLGRPRLYEGYSEAVTGGNVACSYAQNVWNTTRELCLRSAQSKQAEHVGWLCEGARLEEAGTWKGGFG